MYKIKDIRKKRILYITTKNTDYIRVTQETGILKNQENEVTVAGSSDKSYLKRLLHVWKFLLKTDMEKYDMTFVGFAPQLVIPLFKRKLKKKTLIMDFFISVYDTLVFDRKKFRPGGFIAGILKRLDTFTINAAEWVIADTRAHADYFCSEFGYPAEKTEVLYLEADRNIYYPRECVKPDKYQGKFVVLYFGSILPLQGIEVILDAAELLENEDNLRIVVIGPVKCGKKAQRITEYIDWLPQEELAEYISYADLCLGGHFSSDINKAKRTIAGKTYIYTAMEKPVILGDNSANRELFEESDKVHFVPMGDAKALARAILKEKQIYEKDCWYN